MARSRKRSTSARASTSDSAWNPAYRTTSNRYASSSAGGPPGSSWDCTLYSRLEVLPVGPSPGVRMVGSPRRYLVLGLDGGTFDLLDPLMEAGELPFLSSLVQRGARAPLRSVYPAKTIPAWYSFATGKDPGELGIFGFTEPGESPGRSNVVQSFRPQEAFWDRLSRIGKKVGVLNFPMAAAYPLHGFVLPGMLSERPTTYPVGLRDEVEAAIGGRYPGELPTFRESSRDAWIAQATDAVVQRARAAAALAVRHRPDFLFALFRETDRIEHQHWAELGRPVGAIPADLLAF